MGPYFDRDGKSMTMLEHAERFDDVEYKHVAFDRVDDVEVSTVWVGINMPPLSVPPLIFETMVFGGLLDEHSYRYATLDDALEGHAAVLELARAAAIERR